jgi:hypothetical protein
MRHLCEGRLVHLTVLHEESHVVDDDIGVRASFEQRHHVVVVPRQPFEAHEAHDQIERATFPHPSSTLPVLVGHLFVGKKRGVEPDPHEPLTCQPVQQAFPKRRVVQGGVKQRHVLEASFAFRVGLHDV